MMPNLFIRIIVFTEIKSSFYPVRPDYKYKLFSLQCYLKLYKQTCSILFIIH